jgi:hypothetical protein
MTTQIVIDRITAPHWAEGFLLDGIRALCHSSMTWTPCLLEYSSKVQQ